MLETPSKWEISNGTIPYPISPMLETFFGLTDVFYKEPEFFPLTRIHPNQSLRILKPMLSPELPSRCVEHDDNVSTEFPHTMETGEDKGQSSYESLSSPDVDSGLSDSQFNHPFELDEIELRSRALRSLLLKKHASRTSSEISLKHDSVNNGGEKEASTKTTQTNSIVTRLSFGSGKHFRSKNEPNRFIITLGESSASDDDEFANVSHSISETVRTPSLISATSTYSADKLAPQVFAAVSSHVPKGPTEIHMLNRKLNIIRLSLKVKRQQRIVDDKRKSTLNLFKAITALRKQLKERQLQYKQSTNALTRSERLLFSYQKNLSLAVRHCSRVQSNPVKEIISPTLDSPHNRSENPHYKELLTTSLDILEQARLKTAYFAYFLFDPPNYRTRVAGSAQFQNNAKITLGASNSSIDPNVPICPFLLDGDCKDKSCVFQHPATFVTNSVSNEMPKFSDPANSLRQGNHVSAEILCPYCCSTAWQPEAFTILPVQRWHHLYSSFRKFGLSKNSIRRFISASNNLRNEYPTSLDLLRHHIFLVCSFFPKVNEEEIYDLLNSSSHSLEVLRLILRNVSLPSAVRRSVANKHIHYLLQKVNHENTEHISSYASLFIFACYHYIKLLLEFHLKLHVTEFLDNMLADSSIKFAARCGLWWIKLFFNLMDRLPSEDLLFSVSNIPVFANSLLEAHSPIIVAAVKELGITSFPVANLDSLPDVSHDSIPLHCYLAILHVHIQWLMTIKDHEAAFRVCLELSQTDCLRHVDDLFFPTAIFALSHTSVFSANVLQLPEPYHSQLSAPFRVELTYLHAHLLWRRSAFHASSSTLINSLAGFTYLSSTHHSAVSKAYDSLLLPIGSCQLQRSWASADCARGLTYLWLSFGLYSLMSNADMSEQTLRKLISFHEWLLKNGSSESVSVFHHSILHMIVTLINQSYTSDPYTYLANLTPVLLDRPICENRWCLPTWLIELVQRVDLFSLPSPGLRHDFCVSLVETYGSQLITSLCRTLFAINDQFLARSLCAIGTIDKPDNSDFWLLYAALLITSVPQGSIERKQYINLSELFHDAVCAVPSSLSLWIHYSKAIFTAGANYNNLTTLAENFQVSEIVSKTLNALETERNGKKRTVPPVLSVSTGTTNRWIKTRWRKYMKRNK